MAFVLPVAFLISNVQDIWWGFCYHRKVRGLAKRLTEIGSNVTNFESKEEFMKAFAKAVITQKTMEQGKIVFAYLLRNFLYIFCDLGVISFLVLFPNFNVQDTINIEDKVVKYFTTLPDKTFPFELGCEYSFCGVTRLPEHKDLLCQSGLNYGLTFLIPSLIILHLLSVMFNLIFGIQIFINTLSRNYLLKVIDPGNKFKNIKSKCSRNELLMLVAIYHEIKVDTFIMLLEKYNHEKFFDDA